MTKAHKGAQRFTRGGNFEKIGTQQPCYLSRVERQKLSSAIMSPLMTYWENVILYGQYVLNPDDIR